MAAIRQQELIERLRDPSRYPHPVDRVEVLQTHISYVLLAGDYAYKIKKAMDLGFLNYSTLALRQFYCEEEMRLNPRLATGIYLGVVPIGGSNGDLRVGASPPIEYAVRMHRFAQQDVLECQLASGTLQAADLEDFAITLADFHATAPAATGERPEGTPAAVYRPMAENFTQIRDNGGDSLFPGDIAQWTESRLQALRPVLQERRAAGFVRECHGDLHLGNLLLRQGRVLAFDGIEFSPELRWIDTISETAFLVMDLEERGHGDLAYRFLNGYLERNGDYAGLRLLNFYRVYRAMVRAKVALLQTHQGDTDGTAVERFQAYLGYARARIGRPRPRLLITHGLSGSGKTFVSGTLLAGLPAIRLRSDIERKRLWGLGPLARTGAAVGVGLYGQNQTRATYDRLLTLSQTLLQSGESVIVDAAFLQRDQRDRFRALAGSLEVPFRILACRAPPDTLRRRLREREGRDDDASDAGTAVLEQQRRHFTELEPDELALASVIDTQGPPTAVLAAVEQVTGT